MAQSGRHPALYAPLFALLLRVLCAQFTLLQHGPQPEADAFQEGGGSQDEPEPFRDGSAPGDGGAVDLLDACASVLGPERAVAEVVDVVAGRSREGDWLGVEGALAAAAQLGAVLRRDRVRAARRRADGDGGARRAWAAHGSLLRDEHLAQLVTDRLSAAARAHAPRTRRPLHRCPRPCWRWRCRPPRR